MVRIVAGENLSPANNINKIRLVGLFKLKTDDMMADDVELEKTICFNHCQQLNDASTIAFNQRYQQETDVYNEDLGIWIAESIDVEKDNCFIPRDDTI